MRRVVIPTVTLLVLMSLAAAQEPLARPHAVTFQKLTVGTSAVGLSAGTVTPADGKGAVQRCNGRVEGAAIRMRAANGIAPTATVGLLAKADEPIVLEGSRVIAAWKAIRDADAATDATVTVECYREYRP